MPARNPPNLRIELARLGVLACLWGSSYLLIEVALATIPPWRAKDIFVLAHFAPTLKTGGALFRVAVAI